MEMKVWGLSTLGTVRVKHNGLMTQYERAGLFLASQHVTQMSEAEAQL